MREITTRMIPGDASPVRLKATRRCPGCGHTLLVPEDATALSAAASVTEFDRKHGRCRAGADARAGADPSP